MKTTDLKKDISQIINKIDDENILQSIKIFIYNQVAQEDDYDFWDELPESVKASINIGIKQADAGELTPHNEVMETIKSKYLNK